MNAQFWSTMYYTQNQNNVKYDINRFIQNNLIVSDSNTACAYVMPATQRLNLLQKGYIQG